MKWNSRHAWCVASLALSVFLTLEESNAFYSLLSSGVRIASPVLRRDLSLGGRIFESSASRYLGQLFRLFSSKIPRKREKESPHHPRRRRRREQIRRGMWLPRVCVCLCVCLCVCVCEFAHAAGVDLLDLWGLRRKK